jgi:hypothetical protein
MAKHRSHKRRSHSKSRTMRRGQHGGALAGNPPSAWGWGMGTLGNGWTQFMNSLTLQPGQNLGTVQSNNIVPVGGVNAQDSQGMIGPNMKGDIPQAGGKRRRRSRAKRGGNVFAQAAVPFTLVAMNQAMGKRSRSRSRR